MIDAPKLFDRRINLPRPCAEGSIEPGRAGAPGSSPPLSPDYSITIATAADEPGIAGLLRAAELPCEDFAPHLAHFRVARDAGGAVVGAIGAEVKGADALLCVLSWSHQSAGGPVWVAGYSKART